MENLFGLYNHTEIFRKESVVLYQYKYICVVVGENGKVKCFDALKYSSVREAIEESLKCIDLYGLNRVDLMFNGIKIEICEDVDIEELINKYLLAYKKLQDSTKQTYYI